MDRGHGIAARQSVVGLFRDQTVEHIEVVISVWPPRDVAMWSDIRRRQFELDDLHRAAAQIAAENLGRLEDTLRPIAQTGAGGAHFLDFADHDLPLGIEGALAPMLRRVDVPESSLLVFYTDGVTEHDRKPLTGAAALHDAAIFAYNFASLPRAQAS